MSKARNDGDVGQLGRFIETARALGCDEDKARFDAALEKIATHKPKGDDGDHPHPPKPSARKAKAK